ncbi:MULTISPECIES: sugar MFS transporter [unclassified Haematospirillum]|uniref:sugar MFS transporter n=1 Tax=unclassified Haematospirillum TaxID=2622088 RepID=UPI00143B68DC|nr:MULTISPECIES: sugar MFS transporter [unclassified Haematospirillum]NKD54414.1 sugar MFS transporter [Haematospirillum sp. H4890]NKD74457.1 sugar MFS transporter [Haematospirillum sp. H4485]
MSTAHQNRSYFGPLAVLTAPFFFLGMITCLNDVLVPHLKAVFTLSYAEAALVQFCFFTAYFFVSLPSGMLAERIGYKRGLVVGFLVTAAGCMAFWPAASERSYPLFLGALFILASGITLIQVCMNPYVSILGKQETASSRLAVVQAFNSVGTTIAPYIGSLFILSTVVLSASELAGMSELEQAAYRAKEAASVQGPYMWLAGILIANALALMFIKLPDIRNTNSVIDLDKSTDAKNHGSIWSHRHLVLGTIGIFMYVGAEVAIGSFLINLLAMPEIAGLPEAGAGFYLSLYWGGAMVGRFVGAAIMRYVNPGAFLSFNCTIAIGLIITAILSSGHVAMWSLIAVGLFNSIMFPTIFTLSVRGLGHHTSKASGILCMAIVGGAIVPLIHGFVADQVGLLAAFFVPLVCYAYILYYGVKGHRAGDAHQHANNRSLASKPAAG